MELTKMKKCPFCGGEPETIVDYDRVGGDEFVLSAYVKCSKCSVYKRRVSNMKDAPFTAYEVLFNSVIADWNKRAEE